MLIKILTFKFTFACNFNPQDFFKFIYRIMFCKKGITEISSYKIFLVKPYLA